MSSSRFCGFSGKKSPCFSMNSSNCSCVCSPRASASSISLSARSMSLTRCMSSGVAFCSASRMPGELRVEHLAAQQVLDLLVRLPRPPASASRTRRSSRTARAGVVRQRVELGLGQPRVVGRVGEQRRRSASSAWSSSSRTCSRVPSSRPRVGAARGAARGPAAQLVQPARPVRRRGAAAGSSASRGRRAGEHVVADLVERLADVVRRRQRVRPAVPRRRSGSHRVTAATSCRQRRRSAAVDRAGRRSSSLASRLFRCRPSRANSTAAAATPIAAGPSPMPSGSSRSSSAASPGTGPSWASSSLGGDRVAGLDGQALVELRLQRAQVRARPAAPGRSRRSRGAAGARAPRPRGPRRRRRTRPCRARPGRRDGRSATRATAIGSPVSAARRTADAATVSTAGDREPGRDAGALVDLRRVADGAGEAARRPRAGAPGTTGAAKSASLHSTAASWRDQGELVVELERVVRADLGAEPVLERGDDPAAVGVVLGVRAGDEQQVERQPQLVAADLDVALLQHVEQRDLDALGQVGQLVDREDAAVGARHQPVVDGLGIAERAALGDLDRVDVADQVADAGVRGGELLAVALAAVLPGDRRQRRRRSASERAGSARTPARTGGR